MQRGGHGAGRRRGSPGGEGSGEPRGGWMRVWGGQNRAGAGLGAAVGAQRGRPLPSSASKIACAILEPGRARSEGRGAGRGRPPPARPPPGGGPVPQPEGPGSGGRHGGRGGSAGPRAPRPAAGPAPRPQRPPQAAPPPRRARRHQGLPKWSRVSGTGTWGRDGDAMGTGGGRPVGAPRSLGGRLLGAGGAGPAPGVLPWRCPPKPHRISSFSQLRGKNPRPPRPGDDFPVQERQVPARITPALFP